MTAMGKQCIDFEEAFTHSGVFHADDVFAAALLQLFNPNIHIIRGAEVPEGFAGIVFDIGGGRFDHHYIGAPVRPNGVPFASFGLLWDALGEELLEKEDADKFDAAFVQPIDASDNGGAPCEISQAVSDFNPNWDDGDQDYDARFDQAVDWARGVISRRIGMLRSSRRARNELSAHVVDCRDGVMVLDCWVPWREAAVGTTAAYVVFPSPRGGYNVQAVPVALDSRQCVRPFPQAWCGLEKGDLVAASGCEGLTFCHKAGFLCAAETREAAERAARRALDWSEGD